MRFSDVVVDAFAVMSAGSDPDTIAPGGRLPFTTIRKHQGAEMLNTPVATLLLLYPAATAIAFSV